MKKALLALALVATVMVSCNKTTSTSETAVDSTAVQVDSVSGLVIVAREKLVVDLIK